MEQETIFQSLKRYATNVFKLLWQLPRQDYLAHFIVGVFIFLLFDKIMEAHLVILVALGVGIAKELVYDLWMGRGTPEVQDVIFTVLGAIGVYLTTLF